MPASHPPLKKMAQPCTWLRGEEKKKKEEGKKEKKKS